MHEEMKLWWVVAFALRLEALSWCVSWKVCCPNASWWNFSKAILKIFLPEVWDCVQHSKLEESITCGIEGRSS